MLTPLTSLGAAVLDWARPTRTTPPSSSSASPAFTLRVEPGELPKTFTITPYHTFDKVDPRLMAIDTAVMGVAALETVQATQKRKRLPWTKHDHYPVRRRSVACGFASSS